MHELKLRCRMQEEALDDMRHRLDSSRQPDTRDRGFFPKVSVSKFTGTEDLDDYLIQFEAVSTLQRWTEDEKAVILLSKLEKSALSAVNTSKSRSYTDMVICLKENFSPEQRELSLQKLQVRKQKKEESFSVMAADIQRLALKAYPSVDSSTRDTIATDHFVNAITNINVRQKLREKHPKDLSTAIREARQILADQETETMLTKRSGDRAHMIEESDTEVDRLRQQVCLLQKTVEDRSEKKTKEASDGKGETKQTKARRRVLPPTCYHCGYVGHVQRWCPQLMPSKTEPVPIRNGKPVIGISSDKKQENSSG